MCMIQLVDLCVWEEFFDFFSEFDDVYLSVGFHVDYGFFVFVVVY